MLATALSSQGSQAQLCTRGVKCRALLSQIISLANIKCKQSTVELLYMQVFETYMFQRAHIKSLQIRGPVLVTNGQTVQKELSRPRIGVQRVCGYKKRADKATLLYLLCRDWECRGMWRHGSPKTGSSAPPRSPQAKQRPDAGGSQAALLPSA